MAESKKQRDPIPKNFQSVDELDEFWSTHSLADYDDLLHEVHFHVKLDKDEFVPVKREIARKLAKRARQRKISVSELVNQLLEEKLREAAQKSPQKIYPSPRTSRPSRSKNSAMNACRSAAIFRAAAV